MKYTVALVSAFPPSNQSLNEYGYHLAINFAKDPRVRRVIVIADELPNGYYEPSWPDKIEIRRVWRFNSLKNVLKVASAIRESNPHLAVYNVQTASFGDRELPAALGLMAPMLTRNLGTPSGVIAHNTISKIDLDKTILKNKRWRQRFVKLGGRVIDQALIRATYVTFTLPKYVQVYKKRFPTAKIYHVPHGVFDSCDRSMLPFEKRPNIAVTMGKFGTYKRLETLIEAMDIVAKQSPLSDVKLVIGGTDHPNARGYMKSISDKYKQRNDIKFCGYVPEESVADFFGKARASVFDYNATTGSSGVLHQTACYGAVPIFPKIGDFIDVIENEGIEGVNYIPGDSQDLANAIARVLNDNECSAQMGASNRKRVEGMQMSEIVNFHLSKIEL